MPAISRLQSVGPIINLNTIFAYVDIKCPNCGASRKNIELTLNKLKNFCSDYKLFKDAENKPKFAVGRTNNLTCPNCSTMVKFLIGVHRNGSIIILKQHLTDPAESTILGEI